ncbi:galactose oxidase/kelch repeat superfamily protein [Carex rostrata]
MCFRKLSFGQEKYDPFDPLIPGLPEEIAKLCIALVPRSYLPTMGSVSKAWRKYIRSKEFMAVRREAGRVEEWIYFLTGNPKGKEGIHWEVSGSGLAGGKTKMLPPMPGQVRGGFGVIVVDGKLLVLAGYTLDEERECFAVSNEVYEYDSLLNRWTILAKMNVARYDFACAEVDGLVYAVGGFGSDGDSLSSTEVYDPDTNQWTLVKSLRRPRWGCFAYGLSGNLYVMGGRSSFTIGNSRSVDIYAPKKDTWREMKNGCVMVTAHAVLGSRLFCVEWKNQRRLSIFDPADNSWHEAQIPLTGSSSVCFCFGMLEGKLLLFSSEEQPGYRTLVYNPDAPAGSEWMTSAIRPPGVCLNCITIEA